MLTAAALGALAGAGGLAWWLWRQSRLRSRPSTPTVLPEPPTAERAERKGLPDRVQQLNQAIEDVRRQLESLQSQP
jgi:hypothetical protein